MHPSGSVLGGESEGFASLVGSTDSVATQQLASMVLIDSILVLYSRGFGLNPDIGPTLC